MDEGTLKAQLEEALTQDDFELADRCFTDLIKQGLSQEDGETCYIMGIWYRQQDMLKKSIATLRQGLLLNSNDGLLHFELAVSLQLSGALMAARQHFQQSISLIPNFVDARFCLGKLAQQEGRFEEAAALFCEIIEIMPFDLNIHIRLAVEFADMAMSDQAIQLYFLALLEEPENGNLYSNLGVEFADLGDFSTAEFCHRKALALDEENGDLWYNSACTYALMNEPMLAFYALEQAITLNEENKLYAAEDEEFYPLRQYSRFWDLVGEDEDND